MTEDTRQDDGSIDSEPVPADRKCSLAEFFAELSPGSTAELTDVVQSTPSTGQHSLVLPLLRLHCPNEACDGYRNFTPEFEKLVITTTTIGRNWVMYSCRDCVEQKRYFALAYTWKPGGSLRMHKAGELPAFGPPTPSRLITLIGPDREYWLRGRRAENQGMGVGAYAYYRRVVESQKNRILAEVLRVARKLRATQATLDAIETARAEVQFSKAMEDMSDAIPEILRIDGANPFTLLHHALSRGIHEMSDAECLELAGAIRVVLAELADRMSQALKDGRELADAVTRLNQVRSGQRPER